MCFWASGDSNVQQCMSHYAQADRLCFTVNAAPRFSHLSVLQVDICTKNSLKAVTMHLGNTLVFLWVTLSFFFFPFPEDSEQSCHKRAIMSSLVKQVVCVIQLIETRNHWQEHLTKNLVWRVHTRIINWQSYSICKLFFEVVLTAEPKVQSYTTEGEH